MRTGFDRRGITLIEILIAFTILVLSMLPISGLIGFGHKGTQKDLRNVHAMELLVDRMNQIGTVPFRQLNTLIGGGNVATLTAAIFGGTNLQVDFGEVTRNGCPFTILGRIERTPVSLNYRPVNFGDPAYDFSKPETFTFWAERTADFIGPLNTDYKVMKTFVSVSWPEQGAVASRSVNALTFVVDLED